MDFACGHVLWPGPSHSTSYPSCITSSCISMGAVAQLSPTCPRDPAHMYALRSTTFTSMPSRSPGSHAPQWELQPSREALTIVLPCPFPAPDLGLARRYCGPARHDSHPLPALASGCGSTAQLSSVPALMLTSGNSNPV